MLGLSLFLSLSFTSDRRVRDTHPRPADCVHLLVVCLGFGVCKNGPTCLRSEHVPRTDQTCCSSKVSTSNDDVVYCSLHIPSRPQSANLGSCLIHILDNIFRNKRG